LTRCESEWRGAWRTPSRGGDPDVACLRAKAGAMVDRASGFVLPLMNHLVEERVQDLIPSMPAKMAPLSLSFM